MHGVEFEENEDIRMSKACVLPGSAEKPSFMMRFLEKVGIANKTTANFILLGTAILFFGITIYLYSRGFGDTAPTQTDEEIAAQMKTLWGM